MYKLEQNVNQIRVYHGSQRLMSQYRLLQYTEYNKRQPYYGGKSFKEVLMEVASNSNTPKG